MQSVFSPRANTRMKAVREALRLRRLARRQRLRWDIYVEHHMLEEAGVARREVLDSLRSACVQWRRLLGIVA